MILRRRAVFLDRDGVLVEAEMRDGTPGAPASAEAMRILPGVAEALARLRERGLSLIVVSNQPDVARGSLAPEELERMHERLRRSLPLDDILVCPHDDAQQCPCRKPKPGMILEAAQRHHVDLRRSFLVGDRWRDVEAAHAAGCTAVFIDRGYRERSPQRPPAATVTSLPEAAAWILDQLDKEEDAVTGDLSNWKVKIFADGADKATMLELARDPRIRGFTTNPTLMRKAGVTDYERFAREILEAIPDRPVSLEVFADDFQGIERQARKIASWGPNVYVKIPVTNTQGESCCPVVHRLSHDGVQVNVTAILTLRQVYEVTAALAGGAPAYVSVFAGRIADTGRDPVPIMAAAAEMVRAQPRQELIWASVRELLNVVQAEAVGCHIITVTSDVLKKLPLLGKDLAEYSLETVRTFYEDARRSGYQL